MWGADSKKAIFNQAINYLIAEQVKATVGEQRFAGEWPSFMMNDGSATLLGQAGKRAYDSNCFTTASIYNSLAGVFQNREKNTQIAEVLNAAISRVQSYAVKDRFGFWPILPRTRSLYPPDFEDEIPLVRRPNNYVLDNAFVNNASNIPEDADDTAVAYLALKKHNELADSWEDLDQIELPNQKPGEIFSQYRDIFKQRKTIHYYNLFNGGYFLTGAFMTWFSSEKFFTPWSWLPINTNTLDRPYIPYGANEVDCVVNSNILTTLASFNQLETKGVEKSCRFINKAIRKKQFSTCGLYYPNRFEIHYTTAKAISSGVTCLEESRERLIEDILETQTASGRFESHMKKGMRQKIIKGINRRNTLEKLNNRWFRKDWNPQDSNEYDDKWMETLDPADSVQATLYALLALVKIADPEDPEVRLALDRGWAYLAGQLQRKNQNEVYFPGGIFFAGGTLVRQDIVWRSDAYTTALAVEFLDLYQRFHVESE